MNWIVKWFVGIGEFFYRLSQNKDIREAMNTYGPIAEKIVEKVAVDAAYAALDSTGRRDAATVMLREYAPKLAKWMLHMIVESAYGLYISAQESIDTDGDGVPDYRDLCREIGDQGCGVDADGCPVKCPEP